MILFTSIAILILAIVLSLFNFDSNKNGLFLSGFLVPISISGIAHYFFLFGQSSWSLAVVYGHFIPLLYLSGPMLYFYVKGSLKRDFLLSKWDYLHFLPFIISILYLLPYYFLDFSFKLKIAESIITAPTIFRKNNVNGSLYNYGYDLILRPIHLVIYCIFCISLLIRSSLQNKKNSLQTWLYCITLLSGICSISYTIVIYTHFNEKVVLNDNLSLMGLNFIIRLCLFLIPILLLIFPQVLYGLPIANLKKHTFLGTSLHLEAIKEEKKVRELNEEEKIYYQNLTETIITHLKQEKPFTDPDFGLDDLSQQLNIQKQHLYYCFNSVLNIRFTTLRTQLRIEYAKECLLNGDLENLSMEGVWTKTGFSSRTSFFVSFKEITGLTPLDFIKNTKNIII